MSKYNLTDILNEYVGGSRHGTINISFRDLVDAMETIEKDGDFVVRELPGPSGDGKTNREFEVVFIGASRGDNKQEEAGFTVYDYKFGLDPGDIDNYEEEYDFSIGGSNKEAALKIAKYLLGDRVQGYRANDKEILKNFDPKDINDVLFSFESNTDEDGEFKTSMGFNEQMYVDDDEFNKEMGRSKKDSLRKEMMFHVNQLMDGNIDKNDFMNVVEDIMMDLGLKEEAIKEPIKLKDALERYSFGEILDTAAKFYEEDGEKDMALLARQTAAKFRKMLDDFDGGVGKMKESTGPSDKAETEDDVVNVDKVAGPSAKGRNYGAKTSANTAEDDQEDKEIQNPPPMYEDMKLQKLAKKLGIDLDDLEDKIKSMRSAEKDKIEATAKSAMAENGDAEDFTKELKEAVAEEESVADYLMDYYRNPNKPEETMVDEKIVGEYYKTHPDWDLIWGKSYEDGLEDFQEFFDANYGYMFPSAGEIDEDLKKHFKRFM